jgi:signal peptidase I
VELQEDVLPKKKAKGQIIVKQSLGGRSLPSRAVKERSEYRFHLIDGLFRGRNDLTVQVGDREPFHFPLYYKTTPVEWAEALLKALILVVVVKTFVIQAFFIPTGSMEDTLFPSDYILVEKVTGLFRRAHTGDVIVFQYPKDPTKDFIKRKAADQGDKIAMFRKQLYVDDKCLDEHEYAVHKKDEYFPIGTPYGLGRRDNFESFVVPEKHSWAMGDNRDNSQDSRFWGALPDYRMKGRALAIYFPFRRWRFIRPEHGIPREPGDCPSTMPKP